MKHRRLFTWGPIDGQLLPVSYWPLFGIPPIRKEYAYLWPTFYLMFKHEQVVFLCDDDQLHQLGIRAFQREFFNVRRRKTFFHALRVVAKDLERVQHSMQPKTWPKLSVEDIWRRYQTWEYAYRVFWDLWLVPELANWGGETLLRRGLLHERVPKTEVDRVMAVLSAPVKFSFFQQEQYALLAIGLLRNQKARRQALKRHANRYSWILNSYHSTRILTWHYFSRELQQVAPSRIAAAKARRQLRQTTSRAKLEKGQITRQYGLSREMRQIADLLAESIWLQDDRKARIWQATAALTLWVKEAARRWHIPAQAVLSLQMPEFSQALKIGRTPKQIIARRKGTVLFVANRNHVVEYSGTRAEAALTSFRRQYSFAEGNASTLHGISVSVGRGIIRGRVRIIRSTKDVPRMRPGEVLVSTMTAPDYILAMRRAAAIVTDAGGLTSHAAIVSRELGLPCIVGTHSATKLLKDGDWVEVDASKGVVRKL